MSARGRPANAGWLQEGMIRGHMLGKTMLPGDEELGKKDDDHRYAPARRTAWSTWQHKFRWRRKRVLLVLVGLCLGYMVLKGTTGLGRVVYNGRFSDTSYGYVEPVEPTGPPPGIQNPRGETPHSFDGPIRFYRLKSSIRQSASHTRGHDDVNRNVLFAASSLKSASNLLPMVCEMSKWNRNHVHFMFIGRDDIPMADLLEINGIDEKKCRAVWHDARPDYFEYSGDSRAETSVVGAMSHIRRYLHPQVAIVDNSLTEDDFFVRGMKKETESLTIPLIEIPKEKIDTLTWITRLDAGSLRHWHTPTIDILIQVPSESSSVLRLLRSIQTADYSGLRPPRIILELPAKLDHSVKRHLEHFKWPAEKGYLGNSDLTIRRRIANHRATQQDAAIRFLELFYPASPHNSHVLLLSPQAQLSPLYLHYIKYTILEYQYSFYGAQDSINVMGASLEVPAVVLDGKSELTAPTISDMHTTRYNALYSQSSSTPFLWQAPNSHATVFFGNKWAEFHSFLGHRVAKHGSTARSKMVSEVHPAWTEYMLEFMRARGYLVLYPAKSTEVFVTIHNELYQAPEEFAPTAKGAENTPGAPSEVHDEPFLRGDSPARPLKQPEPRVVPNSQALHLALPFDGDFPEIPHLPQLLHDGTIVPLENASRIAHEYANEFRADVGGCTMPKHKHRKVVPGEAGDLFCYGDEDENDWEDDVDELFKTPSFDENLVDDLESGGKSAQSTSVRVGPVRDGHVL